MFDQLEAAGVATDHLRVEELRPTGISAVLVERDDRAIITAPGTISDLAPEDLDTLGDVPAAHVHVSSYYLMSPAFRTALPAHLRRFRTNGCTTSIDTNWDPSGEWLLDDALAAVDLFLPNKTELLEITGRSSIGDALDVLTGGGCTVVVKAGEDGAFTRSDGLMIRAPIPAIPGFVDAIGAGDSFNAGFIAARHHGLGVADALKVAVAVGSLSTRAAGGTGGQPDWGEALLWAGLEP
jgi:sugar/nucleoside kinase (ribokinase family)